MNRKNGEIFFFLLQFYASKTEMERPLRTNLRAYQSESHALCVLSNLSLKIFAKRMYFSNFAFLTIMSCMNSEFYAQFLLQSPFHTNVITNLK